MTTSYHTPIPNGSAANASTINNPLSELDAELTAQDARIGTLEGDMPMPSGNPTEYYDGDGGWTVPAGTGASVDGHVIKDEGTSLPQRASIDFVGPGVTVTNETGGTQVSIPAFVTIIEGMQLIWNSVNSLSVGVGACYSQNGDYINVTSLLTASSLSLSSSTWYHVYVYLTGGTPNVEVITTSPTAWKVKAYSKSGDTSRRYVGSVKTDGSGNIYQFTHNLTNSLYLYINQTINASPFRCLSSGTGTTATAVSLSGVVPITASMIWIRPTNTSDQVLYVGVDSSLSSSKFQIALVAGNVVQLGQVLFLPASITQTVHYVFASAPGVGGVNIDVYGYIIER